MTIIGLIRVQYNEVQLYIRIVHFSALMLSFQWQ